VVLCSSEHGAAALIFLSGRGRYCGVDGAGVDGAGVDGAGVLDPPEGEVVVGADGAVDGAVAAACSPPLQAQAPR
jgi:hypothetical protein